ncbi:MAG TPA: DEAD/DEAH box helicase, partial [Gemmataceae bacterium]|nr:DEAD/DEAH box helicase [Gemmataceae bacterium]
MKTLRDYQHWSIYGNEQFPGILRALDKHRSTLLVMATGLGKTVVMSKVANDWTKGNVLCLAHRIELVEQMADTLAGELGYRPSIEQGPRGLDIETLFAAGHVVVGSIQSMITERRARKFRDHPFGLIIIDEAHRATTASYVKLVDRYRELDPECRVLGVTATPNRTDGTALGLVFESMAFEMNIVDGIDAGYLVDIHQKFAVVEDLDLSKIPVTRNEFGEMDFKQADLESLLSQEGSLHAMSRPVLDCTVNGEQAIIFAASVAHAHLTAAVLNHYRPGCAAAIDGSMPNEPGRPRWEIVRRYKEGSLQFLVNFGIATEGFDAPNTSYVIMGRPTKSRLVYTQMLGRCTRPITGIVDGLLTPEERKDAIKASGKPFATVLDFVGNSKMQVVTATDVLGGSYDVDVRDAADEIIGARGSSNALDALAKARASLLLETEELRRRPIRNAVQAAHVNYHLSNVDPFGPAPVVTAPRISRGGSTDAQIAALVNLGVDQERAVGFSKGQAGAVI